LKCSKAKLVLVLKRPAAPGWRADFDTATKRFQALEKAVAKNNGQRLWFLDEDQTPPTIRVSFPLWEQKVGPRPFSKSAYSPSSQKYKKSGDSTFLEDETEEADPLMREIREDHDYRGMARHHQLFTAYSKSIIASQTAKYCSYVPDDYVDAFRNTAKTHHIRLAPIFLSNGKRVIPDQYSIRLENALVEVMFTLHHYYYPGTKGKPATNTFSATIQQVKVLEAQPSIPSSVREPTMMAIQRTPDRLKGKEKVGSKRAEASSSVEDSPTPLKKLRSEGMLTDIIVHHIISDIY
jgi:hypothetical protein